MMNSQTVLQSLSSSELLASTRQLVEDSRRIEADLRHRVPDGALESIFDRALDLLIEQVTKERFATGRKTTGEDGRRCPETGALEFDHVDGFAKTHLHQADRIRLLCRAHNQLAAEKTYGKAFMERARSSRTSTRPGTSPQPRLL